MSDNHTERLDSTPESAGTGQERAKTHRSVGWWEGIQWVDDGGTFNRPDSSTGMNKGAACINRATTALDFKPVTVVCDECGAVLGEALGSPYMDGTIHLTPALVLTHECVPHNPQAATLGDCLAELSLPKGNAMNTPEALITCTTCGHDATDGPVGSDGTQACADCAGSAEA